MIDRWNIEKCLKIRNLLGVSAKEIGSMVYLTRQSINNAEARRGGEDGLNRIEILYTLALKDIMNERGLTLEDLKKQAIAGIEDL